MLIDGNAGLAQGTVGGEAAGINLAAAGGGVGVAGDVGTGEVNDGTVLYIDPNDPQAAALLQQAGLTLAEDGSVMAIDDSAAPPTTSADLAVTSSPAVTSSQPQEQLFMSPPTTATTTAGVVKKEDEEPTALSLVSDVAAAADPITSEEMVRY